MRSPSNSPARSRPAAASPGASAAAAIVFTGAVIVPLVLCPALENPALVKGALFQAACLLCAAALLFTPSGGLTLFRGPVWWAVGAWWVSMLLSGAVSPYRQGLPGTLLMQAFFLIFVILAAAFLSRPQNRERACLWAAWTSVAIVGYGILQMAGVDPLPWEGEVRRRLTSTPGQATLTGAWLAFWIPPAWAIAREQYVRRRYLLPALAVVMAVGLALTQARGAWIGGLTGIGLFVFLMRPRAAGLISRHGARFPVLLALAILAAASIPIALLVTVPPPVTKEVGVLKHGAADAVRVLTWRAALDAGNARPLTGWGPGSFAYIEGRFLDPEFYRLTGGLALHVHNEFLQVYAEQGIIGLAAFLFLAASVAGPLLMRARGSDPENRLLAAFGCGLVALYVCNMGGISLRDIIGGMALWIAAAAAMGASGPQPEQRAASRFPILRTAGAGAALLLMPLGAYWYQEMHASARVRAAKQLLDMGEWERSAQHWREAARARPSDPINWWGLGQALRARGDIRESLAAFRNVLRYSPENARVHREIGQILLEMERYPEAEKRLRTAFSKTRSATSLYGLGATLAMQGKDEEALGAFERAVKLDPEPVKPWFDLEKEPSAASAAARAALADFLRAHGFADRSVANWQEAIELAPGNSHSWRAFGQALLQFGRAAEAEGALRAALALDPRDAETEAHLASAELLQGHPAEARVLLDQALKHDPPKSLRAWILDKLNDPRLPQPGPTTD